jgi:hypothetical protein
MMVDLAALDRSLEESYRLRPNSIMASGSEFKPPQILAPLCNRIPLAPFQSGYSEHGQTLLEQDWTKRLASAALEAALMGTTSRRRSDEAGLAALLIDDVTRVQLFCPDKSASRPLLQRWE